MKYAFLLCFLPLSMNAQNAKEHKPSNFSIGLQSGIVSTYMNVRDYQWYHELCCFGYDDDDLDSAPTYSIHSNLILNYRIKRRHQVGLGLQLSQFGETHQVGTDSREVLNYVGFVGNHELTLLGSEKASIGVYNAFCFDKPAFKDKRHRYSNGVSYMGGLIWHFKIGEKLDVGINGVVKYALSQYNAIAWFNDNHRFGYGLLLGLSYQI